MISDVLTRGKIWELVAAHLIIFLKLYKSVHSYVILFSNLTYFFRFPSRIDGKHSEPPKVFVQILDSNEYHLRQLLNIHFEWSLKHNKTDNMFHTLTCSSKFRCRRGERAGSLPTEIIFIMAHNINRPFPVNTPLPPLPFKSALISMQNIAKFQFHMKPTCPFEPKEISPPISPFPQSLLLPSSD